jgi:O-antigen/teichoic acid export membrane protein
MIFVFLATFLIQALLSARQHPKLIFGYGLALFMNVFLNLLVIPRYSIVGAAATTFITEGVLATAILITAYRHIKFSLEWKRIVQILVSSLVTLAISVFTIHYVLVPIETFAVLGKQAQIINIILGTIISLGILFVSVFVLSAGQITPRKLMVRK